LEEVPRALTEVAYPPFVSFTFFCSYLLNSVLYLLQAFTEKPSFGKPYEHGLRRFPLWRKTNMAS
jgi:hypothetical protein